MEQLGVQRRPIAHVVLLDELLERLLVGIFGIELPHIVGGSIDVERIRPGERGQEERVRLRPAVPNGLGIDHLEFRRLALDQHLLGQTRSVELLVRGHVLEPIAEILRGEGLPVRPFVARTQTEGENAPVLDIDGLRDVRLQLVVRRVSQQAGVAIDHHHASVLGARHQHVQRAAGGARLRWPYDQRIGRQALGDRRQRTGLDVLLEERRLAWSSSPCP